MADKPSVKRHNRMLKRNLEGLLSKCYRYGKLRGVELGIYIEFTERDQFVSYETPSFSCQDSITEKKKQPLAQNYLPDCLPVGVQKKLVGTASQPVPGQAPQTSVRRSSARFKAKTVAEASPIGELPSLPIFDFMLLGPRNL